MEEKIIYYVVDLCTTSGEGYYDSLTGDKIITGYTINDNIPAIVCEIRCDLSVESNQELHHWLVTNHSPINEFKLIRL